MASANGSDGGDVRGQPSALDTGRTVLGWFTTPPMHGRTFSKVVLMGPYWSGTNAIREEIIWRFFAPVLNPDKLEVCAPDEAATEILRESLAHGPVLAETKMVGQKCVPRGYKLVGGPGNKATLTHFSRARGRHARNAAVQAQPIGQSELQSGTGNAQDMLANVTHPITLSFEPDTGGACSWWKHAVRQKADGEIDTDDDTLVLLVTKDPLFWLKSMSKHIYPEIKISHGSARTGLDALFSELTMEHRRYGNAIELWSSAMASFLDKTLYPDSRCVILRYEDFLFRFWDVMVHLSAFLPVNAQRLKEPPNSSRSKSHGREVRGREEALRFYSCVQSRIGDFEPAHFEQMQALPRDLLQSLGYDPVPESVSSSRTLCSWVPELRPGDVVATRFWENSFLIASQDAKQSHQFERAGQQEDVSSGRRAYARVIGVSDDGASATLELLRDVPREWIQPQPKDWAVVEWPPDRNRSDPLERIQCIIQTVPRDWVDLRLPYPRCSGDALPITEEGYRDAVGFRSTPLMASFIERVVRTLEVNGLQAGRVLDRNKLCGFSRWFSGEASVQSLAQIKRELPGKTSEHWISFVPPPPTRCLDVPPRPT